MNIPVSVKKHKYATVIVIERDSHLVFRSQIYYA